MNRATNYNSTATSSSLLQSPPSSIIVVGSLVAFFMTPSHVRWKSSCGSNRLVRVHGDGLLWQQQLGHIGWEEREFNMGKDTREHWMRMHFFKIQDIHHSRMILELISATWHLGAKFSSDRTPAHHDITFIERVF